MTTKAPKSAKGIKPAAKAPKGATGIKVSVSPMQPYEVEEAARTIARAEQHKADPQMMAKVKAHVAHLSAAVGKK